MRIDRRSLILGSLAAGLTPRAGAQTPPPAVRGGRALAFPEPDETIDLWPAGAPGMPSPPPDEAMRPITTGSCSASPIQG
jgi:hypothetical protein